ncbi:MAG: MFS transporter [Calditrichaeota bacterium]|nr:MAG: MFS transporter [Calditrichota bacterium]
MNRHLSYFTRSNQTVVMGAIYFFGYGSLGTWLGFFNLFLEQRGFSGKEIGLILGGQQAILFFVVLFWGLLADRYGNKSILGIVAFLSLFIINAIPLQYSFVAMLLMMLGWAFVSHAQGTLMDSLVVSYVKRSGKSSFGAIRVWGSVGWAMTNFLVGYYLKSHALTDIFALAFWGMVIYFIVITFFVRGQERDPQQPKFAWVQFRTLLQKKSILFFLLILFLYGICVTPINLFLNLYFKELGGDYQIVGTAFGLNALSEIPLFFLAVSLVKRFGPLRIIIFSMFVTMLRLLGYGQISDPHVALILSGLNGISFSFFWVATVDYLHKLVPEEWRATGQALLWAFHLGAGVTVGNILIGYLYDFIGMRAVMTFDAGLVLLVLVFVTGYSKKYGSNSIASAEGTHPRGMV